MPSHPAQLRDDAISIWRAGVAAVSADTLVRNYLSRDSDTLKVGERSFALSQLGRIAVVGAGKAGAGMAAAVEAVLGPEITCSKVIGWINVPADCVRPLQKIVLHPARPAGVNEPTVDGVTGTQEILKIVGALGPADLCLVLISGGGSALLPAPVPEISLEDKQAVTRFLMRSGATIQELNTVRKRLSLIKGGGLARASRAGATLSLIISDVVGDPLDIIASGPTVPDQGTSADALAVLKKFGGAPPHVPARILEYLQQKSSVPSTSSGVDSPVANHIIGNNSTALVAATSRAQQLGYAVHSLGDCNQSEANREGESLATLACDIRDRSQPLTPPACLLSGGEPVVQLAKTDQPRKGGRNQQLVLAALAKLWNDDLHRLVILSGGTDGEDGPTDAAGAFADSQIRQAAEQAGLDPQKFLAINDAYTFFDRCGGLLKTGPTHTNVMDLRVVLVAPRS